MEPTEKLMKAATKQTGLLPDRAIKHAVHDFLLAAAAEGLTTAGDSLTFAEE
jgi:hypothetical protein